MPSRPRRPTSAEAEAKFTSARAAQESARQQVERLDKELSLAIAAESQANRAARDAQRGKEAAARTADEAKRQLARRADGRRPARLAARRARAASFGRIRHHQLGGLTVLVNAGLSVRVPSRNIQVNHGIRG